MPTGTKGRKPRGATRSVAGVKRDATLIRDLSDRAVYALDDHGGVDEAVTILREIRAIAVALDARSGRRDPSLRKRPARKGGKGKARRAAA